LNHISPSKSFNAIELVIPGALPALQRLIPASDRRFLTTTFSDPDCSSTWQFRRRKYCAKRGDGIVRFEDSVEAHSEFLISELTVKHSWFGERLTNASPTPHQRHCEGTPQTRY
jgi:hypothetical protein